MDKLPSSRGLGASGLGSQTSTRSGWPGVWETWPFGLLAVLFAFSFIGDRETAENVPEAAALVDRTPPRLPKWVKPPDGIEDVLKDMSRGDCWTASARLRGIRKSQSESSELRTLEGGLFVCAGNGRAAAVAVDPLLRLDFRGEATWVRANAALLMGSVAESRTLLQQIVETDTEWRRSAEALLIRIDSL